MIHHREKRKCHKPNIDAQLGSVDYDGVATFVQESLEGSITTIVTSQTETKTALDIKIVELKTLPE